MRVSSIHELGQIFNNALCFSLYWPFDFFVFLTKLMIVRPNYSRMLPTLDMISILMLSGLFW